jgi:NAD(P)-dependent dehydrogenase (short-subunit alcohol dehydrogenase family)
MTDQVDSIDQRRPVVLVTGGSRGLGNAIAEAFMNIGADVDTLIRQIIERYGFLDVVVNNAGGSGYSDAGSINPKSFTKVVELNLIAPFIVAQRANEVMQTQDDGGVILNIGSVASLRPPPGTAAYNASKAGLVVLTQSLAIEWAPKVRVNCVSPGLINTQDAAERYTSVESVSQTIPLGRLVEPYEVAAICTMLASTQASYVTGANIYVDGGGEIPSFLYALQRHESKDS